MNGHLTFLPVDTICLIQRVYSLFLSRRVSSDLLFPGSLTGSVLIFPITGLLCEYGLDGKGFDGGWPAIFYIFGLLIDWTHHSHNTMGLLPAGVYCPFQWPNHAGLCSFTVPVLDGWTSGDWSFH